MCVDCKHNTTGQLCQVCKEEFYRESGKNLRSPSVCTPCGCTGPGVVLGSADCVKVGCCLTCSQLIMVTIKFL